VQVKTTESMTMKQRTANKALGLTMATAMGLAAASMAQATTPAASAPASTPALERTPDGWYREPARPGVRQRMPLHLRGSFNDWKPGLRMRSDDGVVWRADVMLNPGRYEFKIGDLKWRTVDYGADKRGEVQPGEWALARRKGGNLAFEAPAAGRYTVSFRWVDGANESSSTAWVQVSGPQP
jgi:hypothetical protein